VADDYGDLADGLLALHQATGEARWLTVAGHLLAQARDRFAAEDGGFHDTASDAEQLFLRPRSGADNAEPSGQSSLAVALVTLGALTGQSEVIEAGRGAIDAGMSLAGREPRFGGWTLAGAEALAAGPLQVAVVGAGPEADALARTARLATSPGLVMVHGEPDAPRVPLLEGRPLVGGNPAAYVCRGFVCDRPVTTTDDLSVALSSR
jgi:hypothetical protein